MRVGTVASGISVTKIIDAAVASRYTYDNMMTPVNTPVAEMVVAKCCPISYTQITTSYVVSHVDNRESYRLSATLILFSSKTYVPAMHLYG